MTKKFLVSVIRGSKDEDGAAPYRNVHKVEISAGGTLSLKLREGTTVHMNPHTWETCRVDEM